MLPSINIDIRIPVWVLVLGVSLTVMAGFWLRRRAGSLDARHILLLAAVLALIVFGGSLGLKPLIIKSGPGAIWAFGFPFRLYLHAYGFTMALAFTFAVITASIMGRNYDPPFAPELFMDMAVWVILGSILLARGLHLALEWNSFGPYIKEHGFWALFYPMEGLSFHGGVIGGALAVIIYCRIKRLPLWKIGDCIAPALALGTVFGRLGCFLNGCCYGAPTGSWVGIVFPDAGPVPRHPAMLYQLAGNLVTFLILIYLSRRKQEHRFSTCVSKPNPKEQEHRFSTCAAKSKGYDGRLFVHWLWLYGLTRFVVEYFRRGETGRVLAMSLTWAQWVPEWYKNLVQRVLAMSLTWAQYTSVLMWLTALVLYLVLRSRTPKAPVAHTGRGGDDGQPS